MQPNTEDVSGILGLRDEAPTEAVPQKKRSRLAWPSFVLGLTAPLSLAVICCGIWSWETLAILFLPLFVSATALLLSVSAMIHIVFVDDRKKGIILALIGLVLGGGTLIVVIYLYMMAMAIESCPFFG